jgi:deoxycytidylate deaminase
MTGTELEVLIVDHPCPAILRLIMSAAEPIPLRKLDRPGVGSREILKQHDARELVFAVVGHVGSGTTTIAEKLRDLLQQNRAANGPYEVKLLKAREVIEAWARRSGRLTEPLERKNLRHAIMLQNLGDEMREGDHTAVARELIERIRLARAEMQGIENPKFDVIKPDGKPKAYIIDAIRHPAEAYLLRSLYRSAFALIGVVCQEETREDRLKEKFDRNAGKKDVQDFMERDAKDPDGKKNGQRVSDAFHLADFFIDNSEERYKQESADRQRSENPDWDVPDQRLRLVSIITHARVERPSSSETAMYMAYGAKMRSACLSRQVGAALVDRVGNVVATGTNEVPKAGGGTYGQGFDQPSDPDRDHRCVYKKGFCSNAYEQNEIIQQVLAIKQISSLKEEDRKALEQELRLSRIGQILEFSRAVHAEMDALLSAARRGVSTQGGRLFVTTFPCHYCARHIVGAGVDEVQYIEPYPKSRAIDLHGDSITHISRGWSPPSQNGTMVLFRPFTGVAPGMYGRAFLKDRELKSADGKFHMGAPEWSSAFDISRLSYAELEVQLRGGDGAHG